MTSLTIQSTQLLPVLAKNHIWENGLNPPREIDFSKVAKVRQSIWLVTKYAKKLEIVILIVYNIRLFSSIQVSNDSWQYLSTFFMNDIHK